MSEDRIEQPADVSAAIPVAPAAPAANPANVQRQRASQLAQALRVELGKALIGQQAVIDDVLTALLAGLVNAAIQGAQRGRSEAQNDTSYSLLLNGLAEIAPAYPQAMSAAEDVAKYHFAGFDCLCLRCGARYNEGALDATEAPRQ